MNPTDLTLNWIERLPEVGSPILRQRDDLLALLAQIASLQEIAERRRQALEEEIATLWLPAEIEQAQRHIAA
ncbi:stable inheritance protein KleA [Allochromatium humboldtianum]|uniref:Stable inheritance protein KleA n=1 Tax=Allochromatium humboldtianum TaxID=504901 RepID=A0A850RFD1_9GAMM|nr:stable inheritance protein KleA [Allochromatium humboldtianum]NVZ10077.1 stable inheritance protein KleA [Allochromatium humboldtianum]